MRTLFLLLAGLTAGGLNAQITLDTDDFGQAGDNVRYSNALFADIETLGLDQTGGNQVWDFTALEPSFQNVDSLLSVDESPFLYQLFFNNQFLYPETFSTHCIQGEEFELGGFSLQDPYFYYRNDATDYRETGFGVTLTGLPFSIRYEGNNVLYPFPLEMGDAWQNTYSSELSFPGLFTWIATGERSGIVDAWGTVSLNIGTFDVLRVISEVVVSDSTYVDALELGTNIPRPLQRTYAWIAEGMSAPLLEVVTQDFLEGELLLSVRYQDTEAMGVSSFEVQEWPLVNPNPVHSASVLSPPDGLVGSLTVWDAAGKQVLNQPLSSPLVLPCEDWHSGLYHVLFISDRQAFTQSIVVE